MSANIFERARKNNTDIFGIPNWTDESQRSLEAHQDFHTRYNTTVTYVGKGKSYNESDPKKAVERLKKLGYKTKVTKHKVTRFRSRDENIGDFYYIIHGVRKIKDSPVKPGDAQRIKDDLNTEKIREAQHKKVMKEDKERAKRIKASKRV